jgi:peptidoglycan-associated lipoprotein
MSRAVGAIVVAALVTAGCAKKPAPVARPMPPPATGGAESVVPPLPPPPPIVDPPVVTPPVPADSIGSRSLDDINRNSPLQPVYFALDSFELDQQARTVLQTSADVLKSQPTWQITVEGHCDERGTAEYNLSLGERRSIAAKSYLVTLGIAADRLRTVSYGKEFPFDPGHDEAAWSKNRRAHFVVTAK